jgi:hypothetical protein
MHRHPRLRTTLLALLALFLVGRVALARDVFDRVRHAYADSDGVRIHYATLGRGPLIVMIHGFPDFWYSWNDQMAAPRATTRWSRWTSAATI